MHWCCARRGREAGVPDIEVARWKRLKTKRQPERDPALVYCPVAVCQAPVPATDTQKANLAISESTAYTHLITCPSCSFSFWDLCQRSWRGLTFCPTSPTPRLLLEHLTYPEGGPGRDAMEQRFVSKGNLERMARVWQEEEENRKWLNVNSMQCPNCGVETQKSIGCDHVSFWSSLPRPPDKTYSASQVTCARC